MTTLIRSKCLGNGIKKAIKFVYLLRAIGIQCVPE
jgi:hypothetical protein